MRIKDKNKKTRCPKKSLKAAGIWSVPAAVTADLVGCDTSMVNAVRRGDRTNKTDLGHRISVADDLLVYGTSKLIEEVKRVVQLKTIE